MTKKVFYGWINLGILWLCYMLILSSLTYGFGIIVNDMSADLGLSLTLASGGYTGYQLSQALLSPILGKCANRWGAKFCIIIGGLSMTAGCALMYFWVNSIFLYYIVWVIFIGIAVRFAASSACQISISKWFFEKRGLAMAIFFTSGGLGGYLFTPFLSKLVATYSWRSAWLTMMFCGMLTTLLALFFLKESPADVGQQIDNGNSGTRPSRKSRIKKMIPQFAAIKKTAGSWSLSEAKRNKTFYVLIFFQFVVSFYMVSISNLGISYLNTLSLGSGIAAMAIGTYSLANLFGRILVGMMSDYIDSKYIFLASTALMAIGLLLFIFAQNSEMAFLFSWIAGIGFGMFIVTPTNALVNYFGSAHYSSILSFFGLAAGVICGFNSLIMGALCDLTGNSFIVWCISLALVVAAFFMSLKMEIPQKQ